MTTLLKRQVYASLMEVLKDRDCYYRSGISADYDKLTDKGKEEIVKIVAVWAPHMLLDEEETLDMRAKQMVLKELAR